MSDKWKKYFSQAALEYGKAEFMKNRVVDLKKEGANYTAAVLGIQRYEVKLFMRGNKFVRGKCVCPVAKGGGCCGHMAAVLYAINPEAAEDPAADRIDGSRGSAPMRKITAKEALENAGKATEKTVEGTERDNQQSDEERELSRESRRKRKEEEEAELKRQEEKNRREEGLQLLRAQNENQQARLKELEIDPDDYEILGDVWENSEDEEAEGMSQLASLVSYSYFDVEKIQSSINVPEKTAKEGRRLLEEKLIQIQHIDSGYDRNTGEVCGQIYAEGNSRGRKFGMSMIFSRSEVLYSECRCPECLKDRDHWYTGKTKCAYTAGLLQGLAQYLEYFPLSDATDLSGTRLLSACGRKRYNRLSAEDKKSEQTLLLKPKLIKKAGDLELSFRVGSGKLYVVKDLADFCDKVKNSETSIYGKNTEINHQISNFTEEGKRWIHFLRSVVQEERQHDRRMLEKHYYGAVRSTAVGGSLDLFGWRLDRLFEILSEEETVEYEDRDHKKKTLISCGYGNPDVEMKIREKKLEGSSDFHGVLVEGKIPKLYYGTNAAYYIRDDRLWKTDEEFMEKIGPLAVVSDEGRFSFTIGRGRMAEFYYSVLPGLEDVVSVEEEDSDTIRSYLPPDVKFRFYLDAEEGDVTCRIFSRYAENESSCLDLLNDDLPIASYRDTSREEEMLLQVMHWFPLADLEADCLRCGEDEDVVYRLMSEGVNWLLGMGEVRCTRAFRSRQTVKRVKVAIGVSVSSGLLDLDIRTTDVPPEELLDMLAGYRQKKKYYRLRDGSFVSLEEESVGMLAELADSLRLKDKDFIKGKMHLPLYRTLYLDRMMEEHEEITAERDSRFRAIVKGFKTISDADFEEPESLSGIMRNYQKTGYKWLRTLEAWNFGGILADDMGLGKTLQVISVLLAAKQEGREGTSLIITPASLVFNWGEEFARFAPGLRVTLITGTQEARKELIEDWKESDVLVTSYDLLRRDIALYEEKEFQYQVIDEAQCIKNHTTAAAKAVKAIKSRTRYALTGTPIENRLSELWSIFDYLMPGFLYSYDVFRREIETPIVKYQNEEAAQRLRRMTSPFILRRLKENVLRDLPEKLEEVRYVRFEDAQQKLYDAQVLKLRQSIETGGKEEFNKNRFQILAEITRLRQICCDPSLCYENYSQGAAKVEACVDLVRSAVEGGHRILLFSQFTSMLEILGKAFDTEGIGYYEITGETPKKSRLELVKAFNKGDTPLFLISLKAGGVGLNLTGADVVIHYDPWWNLAVQNQATDRAHRIGQTKKVTVYKLIAKNTIEEKIEKIQEAKRKLAGQIIGGETGNLSGLGREELLELLEI